MMIARYEYRCSICRETLIVEHSFSLREQLPRPRPPAGWHDLDGDLICPRHIIIVKECPK